MWRAADGRRFEGQWRDGLAHEEAASCTPTAGCTSWGLTPTLTLTLTLTPALALTFTTLTLTLTLALTPTLTPTPIPTPTRGASRRAEHGEGRLYYPQVRLG